MSLQLFGDRGVHRSVNTDSAQSDTSSLDKKNNITSPLAESDNSLSGSSKFWNRRDRDLDAIATQRSVFDDPITLEAYRPPRKYENAHRFDPSARWTWREERVRLVTLLYSVHRGDADSQNIVRKIDFRILSWAWIMFLCLNLDRSNISQANSDNFLRDLNLTTNDFNLGVTLFQISFLCAELPSQMISKRLGPDVWIPAQVCLWSIVSLSQFWITGRTTFLACRCLLGICEGGFIPDMVLYLSYFYTKTELPIRIAVFFLSYYISNIFSAFLALGILRLRGLDGKAGWRYLFLLEGCATLLVGIFSWFLMPPGPTQTKTWYRPKGWFTEREETIMVNRVLRDDPTKSDMHNRQSLTLKMIFDALCDWRMWPLYIIGLTFMMPFNPPGTYLTLSLRNLGFTTSQTNLLTVPSTVLGMCSLLAITFFSEMVNSRVIPAVITQLWGLSLLIALYTFDKHTSQWNYYAVVTLIVAYPAVNPMQMGWASRNSNGVGARTVSASLYNMLVQVGGIISANIYRTDDEPLYKRGNRVLIGIASMNIAWYIFTFFFYRTINKRREKIWSSWTAMKQQEYLETTNDKGNQRLDFRFAY